MAKLQSLLFLLLLWLVCDNCSVCRVYLLSDNVLADCNKQTYLQPFCFEGHPVSVGVKRVEEVVCCGPAQCMDCL
jgi:hypothetical protein